MGKDFRHNKNFEQEHLKKKKRRTEKRKKRAKFTQEIKKHVDKDTNISVQLDDIESDLYYDL